MLRAEREFPRKVWGGEGCYKEGACAARRSGRRRGGGAGNAWFIGIRIYVINKKTGVGASSDLGPGGSRKGAAGAVEPRNVI
jgi:hypothetical protein